MDGSVISTNTMSEMKRLKDGPSSLGIKQMGS